MYQGVSLKFPERHQPPRIRRISRKLGLSRFLQRRYQLVGLDDASLVVFEISTKPSVEYTNFLCGSELGFLEGDERGLVCALGRALATQIVDDVRLIGDDGELVFFFEAAELGGGAVHEVVEAGGVVALAASESDTLVKDADGVHVWFAELVKGN